MLKTQRDEYLQKGLTTKIVNFYRATGFIFSCGGGAFVENPVDNVENIHFAVYNFVEKSVKNPPKNEKNRVFAKKRQN